MKLARLETFSTEKIAMVRATAADGAQGWGQTSPYHADISAAVLHRQVAPHVLGADISDLAKIKNLTEIVFEREHKFPGSYLCRAVCGLETALLDILGKRENKPVCELFGGVARPLRAYASSMRRDISPKDEAARFVRLRDECGFDAFKFRVGKECGRDEDESPGRTEEIIPVMRRALGGDVALLADANSCYTPPRAIAVGKILEDCGVCHYEEPCPYWRPQWTKEVTDALSLDVAGGEQDNNLALWRYLIDGRVTDVAQPDVCYVGGMFRAMRVAEMARRARIPITPHSANLSLATVFAMHLICAIPNAGPYLEFSIEDERYYPWQYGVYDPTPVARDGKVAMPDAPGWGVEIREEWLRRAHYQKSEYAPD
ncbi:MAG: mandelate racemase/muconate lactonizing enzyme family protein [Gammaproteobacteria bacterium]